MHKKIMEAALFISTQPLTLDQLARLAGINSLGHVKELVEELQKDYRDRGIEIANGADGWAMQVRATLLPKVAHLTPYSDLAEGPKRTLALITLKEPVKQSEIIRIQGNKAYTYIKDLKKRGLIMAEKEGHTKILKLTQEFERYFGEEKDKIKQQLQMHLQETRKSEGEPVYDDSEAVPAKAEEAPQEFLDEKQGQKEPARESVIKQGAAREVPSDQEPQPPEPPEYPEPEGEPEPDTELAGKKKKNVAASHDHAFKEID